MIVVELEAENILSIGSIKLSFGNSGLVLVDGWNHDDNSHNGAGKTSIFNALSFAIYGKLPRKITSSEILRKGCKSGFSRVLLNIGENELDIKRSRPTLLTVYKNGILVPDITQEQLEIMVRLTYDQFLICMYSAQTESVKLISLNDSSKKDFFLRLLNLEDFAERKKMVDSTIKIKTNELHELESTYGKVETKIATYGEDVVDIQLLTNQQSQIESEKSELEQELTTLSNMNKPDISKFDKLESNINTKLREVSVAEVEISGANTMIRRLNASIKNIADNSLICPHCETSFTLGIDGLVNEEHLKNEIDSHIEIVNSLSEVIKEKQTFQNTLIKLKNKKSDILSDYEENLSKIQEIRSTLRINNMSLKTINEKISKQDEISTKIINANRALKAFGLKISDIKQELLVYETISSGLSPIGAPAYVIDSVIDSFNDIVSQYISLVWPNASYSLQSYKENKSGDIKAKFSDSLMINGQNCSIGSLSGGELRCLSLVIDFSIIDTVEKIFGLSINPIILDEGFEGLDSLNRERVMDLLETLALNHQIMVIDHASEVQSRFSHIIKIEKKDGISQIV